jgi:hypothetical protein
MYLIEFIITSCDNVSIYNQVQSVGGCCRKDNAPVTVDPHIHRHVVFELMRKTNGKVILNGDNPRWSNCRHYLVLDPRPLLWSMGKSFSLLLLLLLHHFDRNDLIGVMR